MSKYLVADDPSMVQLLVWGMECSQRSRDSTVVRDSVLGYCLGLLPFLLLASTRKPAGMVLPSCGFPVQKSRTLRLLCAITA